MPVFSSAAEVYRVFDTLFSQLQAQNGDATHAVSKSKVVIRLNCTAPDCTIILNGRKNPPVATFGAAKLRADVQVDMAADVLHRIFLGEQSLKKAVAAKKVTVRGPVWKTFALGEIFSQGRALYPAVLKDLGVEKE